MEFSFAQGIPLLRATPAVLRAWLTELPEGWTQSNEGPDTCHGERTDWMPRVELLLEQGASRPFTPFDRFAQFRDSQGKSLRQLLDIFAELRGANLSRLESLRLKREDFDRPGLHPELGPVTLGQLLATWVAHDLNHLGQIARVMGHQYVRAVGPWIEYLPLLRSRQR